MNPINYLYFTLVSVLIQFCLMDFISDKTRTNISIDTNSSTVHRDSNEAFKRIIQKPHALYYRRETFGLTDKKSKEDLRYPNTTIIRSTTSPTTGLSTTFDLLYDENITILDNDFTTESFFTSTELDNVTEITFINKEPTAKPVDKTKRKSNDKCYCDLLYQICDLNCCCDADCTENERNIFKQFNTDVCEKDGRILELHIQHTCDKEISTNVFENLFCVAKVNLPEKKNIHLTEVAANVTSKHFKWHTIDSPGNANKSKRDVLNTTHIVWLFKNKSLYTIEIPVPIINNYCSGKKSIRFLVNEDISCYVKLKDLHMLQIYKMLQESHVVMINDSINATALNCSSMHCINWTLIICNQVNCGGYDKDLHEPFCNENDCINIALKIEYIFHCNESGLTDAIVKFSVQTISMKLQFVTQEIIIRFYMTNDTRNEKVQLSGSLGYLNGYPVIASFAGSNHTTHYHNNSIENRAKYIALPHNKNGLCIKNNITHNKLQFGENKSMKCRFLTSQIKFLNGTDGCLKVQSQIVDFLELTRDIFISPYGNPSYAASDKDWILLPKLEKSNIFGEYRSNESKLLCFGIVTRFSFIIVYADAGASLRVENKIVSAEVETSARNLTFITKGSIAAVVTININFIDASKPIKHVYAGAPLLNVHLPKNFFLPFY